MSERLLIHLVLVGDSGVGKTNIVRRYCGKEFTSEYVPYTRTFPAERRLVEIQERPVTFEMRTCTPIHDHHNPEMYWHIRVASGILVVYDVTDAKTFEGVTSGLSSWAEALWRTEHETSPRILVANKIDLTDQRVVTEEQGRALAKELGWLYAETSAKTNVGVEGAFAELSIPALQRKLDRAAAHTWDRE